MQNQHPLEPSTASDIGARDTYLQLTNSPGSASSSIIVCKIY